MLSISVVHDVSDVVDSVGNTDVVIIRPDMALGLLNYVDDWNNQLLLHWPRNEGQWRCSTLVELLLPWLQLRSC